jgi:hypothetical protein
LDSSLVCPRCGDPVSENDFCQTCGLRLVDLPELPTRSAWLSKKPSERAAIRAGSSNPLPVPTVPVPDPQPVNPARTISVAEEEQENLIASCLFFGGLALCVAGFFNWYSIPQLSEIYHLTGWELWGAWMAVAGAAGVLAVISALLFVQSKQEAATQVALAASALLVAVAVALLAAKGSAPIDAANEEFKSANGIFTPGETARSLGSWGGPGVFLGIGGAIAVVVGAFDAAVKTRR